MNKQKLKVRIIYKNGLYWPQWKGLFFWKSFWRLSKTYPWFYRKAHFKTEKEAEILISTIKKRLENERKRKIIKEFEI
jgi:hypothetical protein